MRSKLADMGITDYNFLKLTFSQKVATDNFPLLSDKSQLINN